ncbi:PAS domain S-box protein [Natronomonas halophila]|uniref:PAS domain S-box protein n=1 Tax=Natronomonas halophila TaxID=2747817 RepID=UPI0015B43050|nr:PAS domain S-box protein [Natronomonas halophila]QLD84286.1 PAS domain S-box protein [Natronomonas halophila]
MTATTNTISILHVDDESEFAEMATTFLEREDDRFVIETATGADEAVEYLADNDVDCIVSDYDMPDRNGIEFLGTVREEYEDLPFILYTGKGSEEIASKAISAGVTDYLQKETGTGQYTVLANRITNAVKQYRAKRELEASQKRLSLFIEQSPLGVLEYDNEFNIVGVNEAAEEILGYSEAELQGETWEQIVASSSYENVDDVTSALAETEGGYHSVDENVRKDGEHIVCEWHNRVVTDDDGEVLAIFSLFQDITDRKEHEERLERSTARLKVLFENSPDMIDIHTDDGTVIDVNQQFCEVFDQPKEALVGRKVWDIDQELSAEELRDLWDGMEIGDRRELETEFERDDGKRFPVEVHITRLPVEDGTRFMVVSRDITERRERLREIQTLNERLELAVEGAGLGVWDWDMTTDAVEFNERWATMLGYTLDEIEPHVDAWESRVHPDDLEGVNEALEAHINGETPHYDTEHRMRTAAGDWKWIRDIGRIVERDEDGDPVRAVGIHLDIDDRKRRERELERTRDLLEQTEHIADVGGWEIDTDTKEVFWTEHLFELLGGQYDEEPPLSEALDVYHEDDRPAVEAAVETALSDGDSFDVNARFRRPDGEIRWLRIQGEPTLADDEVTTLRGAVQDVTEQRARERDLQRAREEYEELFNGMNDSAWVIGLDETFLAVNEAAVDRTGYTREELQSMGPHDIDVELEPGEISSLVQDMPDDGVQVIETVHETKDGRRIPVEINSSLISYEDETAVLSIARDISDRKRRERQLEEFASIVSHDLRNPLTVAQGWLEIAREEGDGDAESLERIGEAHHRMNRLIEDLLTLAREGNDVGERESVDLASFVDRCWKNVATADATLRVDIDRTIRADPTRLEQLFENLFRNAVEHGGDQVTVTVGELDTGFYVEDDGPGIPPEDREDVFGYGYSTSEDGTGFGLSIVKQIAEAHDWDIRLTEGTDGGARFEVIGVPADS